MYEAQVHRTVVTVQPQDLFGRRLSEDRMHRQWTIGIVILHRLLQMPYSLLDVNVSVGPKERFHVTGKFEAGLGWAVKDLPFDKWHDKSHEEGRLWPGRLSRRHVVCSSQMFDNLTEGVVASGSDVAASKAFSICHGFIK